MRRARSYFGFQQTGKKETTTKLQELASDRSLTVAAREGLLNRDREGAVWAAFSTRTFAIWD